MSANVGRLQERSSCARPRRFLQANHQCTPLGLSSRPSDDRPLLALQSRYSGGSNHSVCVRTNRSVWITGRVPRYTVVGVVCRGAVGRESRPVSGLVEVKSESAFFFACVCPAPTIPNPSATPLKSLELGASAAAGHSGVGARKWRAVFGVGRSSLLLTTTLANAKRRG